MPQKETLPAYQTFIVIAILALLSAIAAIVTDIPYLYAIPAAILGIAWVITDIRRAYYLLLVLIPLSEETPFSESWAMDLPQEPLLILLTGATWLYLLLRKDWADTRFFQHPIIRFLALHWAWILLAAIFSASAFVSFKFWLAKTWYLSVFVILTGIYIRRPSDLKRWVWCICTPLFFIVIRAFILHAQKGFGFLDIGSCVIPFFRNHVNYGVMLTVLLPYLVYIRRFYAAGSKQKLLVDIGILIFAVGITFAYTRAAYASIIAIPFFVFLFRERLTALISISALVLMTLGAIQLTANDAYLKFAPDSEHTIQHETLGSHFNATFEGKDMSFMERVYRWVAAMNMAKDRPVIGFGPNNFYNFYQKYTIALFQTYVSDNPEKSGVHNYFLMTLVEQGFIGLIIFLLLLITLFSSGEKLYHRLTNPDEKALALTILVSLSITVVNCLVGDLLETDEIGSVFFMGIAMLVNLDIYSRKE
jgi:O-antigen ligase